MNNPSVMIVAAEASSAHYALRLMQFWRSEKVDLHIFGVGSNQMEALGMQRLGKSEEMAVVGLTEAIAHYSLLKSVFDNLIAEVIKQKPKFIILMDYAGFNLRLAKKLKQTLGFDNIKIFYYISPQVWAWRKGRIHDIKKYCDKAFLLFQFEKDFYDTFQVPNEFVGHPLLEDIHPDLLNKQLIQNNRQKFGLKKDEKILALMPGSRRGEIELNFPLQLDVANEILKKHKNVQIIILVAPTLTKDFIQSKCDLVQFNYILIQDEPAKMIALADVVLAASGTATLLVGLLQKPMVIMYKVKWLTGVIGRLLVRGVKFFGLINLVMNEEVVPERFQEKATVKELTLQVEKFLTDESYSQSVIQKLSQAQYKLGDYGATERVGRALSKYL